MEISISVKESFAISDETWTIFISTWPFEAQEDEVNFPQGDFSEVFKRNL